MSSNEFNLYDWYYKQALDIEESVPECLEVNSMLKPEYEPTVNNSDG